MDRLAMLSPRFDVNILKEPLGLIRLIELPLAILAFATTTAYYGCVNYTNQCGHTTTPGLGPRDSSFCWSYPFKISSGVVVNKLMCQPPGGSRVPGYPYAGVSSFSSSAEFFVFVGVITFLICLAWLAIYLVFFKLYRENYLIPYIDMGITCVLSFFWFAGSCAWANGVIQLKDQMSSDSVLTALRAQFPRECGGDDKDKCITINNSWDYASLNVSLILGFACAAVWGANAWFVLKETAFWKARTTQPPVIAGMPRQETPGMTGPRTA